MSVNKFFIQLNLMHFCYIFSPCTLKTCDFKLLDWLDRWSQYGQANGFSPVCTLKWLLMFFFLTILKQIEHFDLPTSNGELSWNNHHLIELPFQKSNIAYQRLPKISVPKFLLNYFSYVCLCYIFTFLVHVFARYAFSCCSIV